MSTHGRRRSKKTIRGFRPRPIIILLLFLLLLVVCSTDSPSGNCVHCGNHHVFHTRSNLRIRFTFFERAPQDWIFVDERYSSVVGWIDTDTRHGRDRLCTTQQNTPHISQDGICGWVWHKIPDGHRTDTAAFWHDRDRDTHIQPDIDQTRTIPRLGAYAFGTGHIGS